MVLPCPWCLVLDINDANNDETVEFFDKIIYIVYISASWFAIEQQPNRI